MPVDPGNPWLAIWLHPKLVMRWVLANDPTRRVQGLILGGSAAGAVSLIAAALGPDVEVLPHTLGRYLLGGFAVSYLVNYFAGPWLLALIGQWIDGKGDQVRVRAAFAYTQIPGIWALVLIVPSIVLLILLNDRLRTPGAAPNLLLALGLMVLGLAQFAVGIWALVIFLACVAVAHGISMWEALGVLAMAGFVLVVALAAVAIPYILMLGSH